MDFAYSPRTVDLQQRLQAFFAEHILPAEPRYFEEIEANTAAGRRWTPLQLIEDLKAKADRKSTRLNSSHNQRSRMPSSA